MCTLVRPARAYLPRVVLAPGINDTVGGNTIACDNKGTVGRLTEKGSRT
ncbi:hypothetical protein ACOZ38_44925 [Sphaerisporangium viridialbum]